tara:strand:+ start:1864 stop:3903 length:2040 start_codon:yes stop_codon:yes gene_type:complete
MGLFGLGDFGTGFVEGFAKSANEALKEDLRKVDLRVEKVAEAKMKRALKQQEERAEELKDIEDALEQGRSLFGTDDPRSAQYAASLLKQEGNLASYKSLISQLQEQTKNSSVNLTDYIQRAEIDSPTGTISDYAKSFQGAAKTLPSYKLPDDIESAGAGSLLSAIGLDQDVSGQIQRNVSEQLAAEGITAEELPNIDVPTLAFDMEGVRMFNMTPSERVTFLKQELARPGNTEERKQELKGDLQAGLLAAKETGDDATQLNSLDMQLGFEQDPTKIAELQSQRKAVDRRIKLKSATNEKDRLLLQSGFAAEDGDAQKAVELDRQAQDLGTSGPLLSTTLERMQEDNMRKLSDHRNTSGVKGYAPDSDEAKAAQEQINALKQTIASTEGAAELDDATYKAALNTQATALKLAVDNSNLKNDVEIDPITKMPKFREGISEEIKKAKAAELKSLRTKVVNDLIITFPVGSPSRIAHTAVKNNLIRAGVVNADESTLDDTAASAETKPVTPSDDAVEEPKKPNKLVIAYPPVTEDGQINTVSANKMADDMITNKSSNTAEQIQENLTQSGYSPDYIKIVVDKVSAARKPRKPETKVDTDVIYKFITEESYGTSSARKDAVIRDIAESSNVSIEVATKLYEDAIAANPPKSEPEKPDANKSGRGRNRSRTGNAGLASGGLMSRN